MSNVKHLEAGGSIYAAAPNAVILDVAIIPRRNTQRGMPATRTIRLLLPALSRAKIGFTTTAPKTSFPAHISRRPRTTLLTNQGRAKGASRPIGSDTYIRSRTPVLKRHLAGNERSARW